MSDHSSIRYAIFQIGSRMHYAVPKILEENGLLSMLFTDIVATKGITSFAQAIPRIGRTGAVRRMLSRKPEIPNDKIKTSEFRGFLKLRDANNIWRRTDPEEANLHHTKKLCEFAAKNWNTRDTHVYAFNTAARELFIAAKKNGARTVLEQTILPRQLETKLLSQAREKFSEWSGQDNPTTSLLEYYAREAEEWNLADRIICASDFVKDGLIEMGVRASKIFVVPYGVKSTQEFAVQNSAVHQPVRVLFVGAVSLRKGAPLVLEAAKGLADLVDIRVIGNTSTLSQQHLQELGQYCDVRGVVPREEMAAHYSWADLFVLPSFCEGSATVTYEALMAGLPVLCTPQSGSLVVNGESGLIFNPFQDRSLEMAVSEVTRNPDLLIKLRAGAIKSRGMLSFSAYSSRLLEVLKF
jgi:glycosyltransferase involved in cell wall biosynthesis